MFDHVLQVTHDLLELALVLYGASALKKGLRTRTWRSYKMGREAD